MAEEGILSVLVINLIGFFLGLISFIKIRHGEKLFPVVKSSASPLLHSGTTQYEPINERHYGFWERFWLFATTRPARFRFDTNSVLRTPHRITSEAVFYLEFQRRLIFGVAVASIIAIGVLLPINIYLGKPTKDDFAKTLSQHIEKDIYLWPHLFFSLGIFGMIFFFLHHFNAYISLNSTRALRYGQANREKAFHSHSPSISQDLVISAKSVVVCDGIPPMTQRELQDYLEELYPSHIQSVELIMDLTKILEINDNLEEKRRELERLSGVVELNERNKLPLSIRCCPGALCCPNPFRLAIGYPTEGEIDRVKAEVEELEEKLEVEKKNPLKSVGRAIIVMNSAEIASNLLRNITSDEENVKIILEKLNRDNWITVAAPEPLDIDWRSISTVIPARRARTFLFNAFTFLFMFILTSPTAFLSTLSNEADNFSGQKANDFINSAIKWIISLSGPLSGLIFSYLPTLMIVGTNNLLLMLLNLISHNAEAHLAESSKERSMMIKAFFYLFFNTIILPSLVVTSASVLFELVKEHQEDLIETIGKMFLLNAGSFFVNYVIQRAFIGSVVELWRFGELIPMLWKRNRVVTSQDADETFSRDPFEFGREYAVFLSTCAAFLSFGVMVPIILPCGLFYIIFKHLVDKYNIVYVCPPTFHSEGLIAHTGINFVYFLNMFCVLVALAFFTTKGNNAHTAVMGLVFWISLIYTIRVYRRNRKAFLDPGIKAKTINRLREDIYNQDAQNEPQDDLGEEEEIIEAKATDFEQFKYSNEYVNPYHNIFQNTF